MKLAVPSKEGHVDNHFGHCDHFTIYTIEEGKVINSEKLESPHGCGCKSGIAGVLKDMGVTQMLAGNMGTGAQNVLERHQISVIRGCSGPADKVVEAFLEGTLKDSAINCTQHEHGGHHECHHGEGKR